MVRGYTTKEQSKHLLELGLDPNTADMCYIENAELVNILTPFYKDADTKRENLPCWSLAALLELMPDYITIKEEGEPDAYYHFQLNRVGSIFRTKWIASYHGSKTKRGKVHTRIIPWAVGPKEESDTSLDAAFEMVCWLIEQKYIKVNK